MYDMTKTRMLSTTAVFAAVAALMVGPAPAFGTNVEGGDSATAVTRQPDAYERAVAHGAGDASCDAGRVAVGRDACAGQDRGRGVRKASTPVVGNLGASR